jgi:PKD repeat protein
MSFSDSYRLSKNRSFCDTKLATINATQNPTLPKANFSSNVSEGYVPLTVQFTDLSVNVTSWNWNFGDGNTSTQQNPTHTYYTAGTYTVNLTGNNSNGIDSKLATINAIVVPILPDANFSTNVSEGYAPLTVQFTDLSTNTTSWNWDFGDGNTSIQQNPTHTYYTVGTYTVNLTGSNSNGTDSKLSTIVITPTPVDPTNLSQDENYSIVGPYIGSLLYNAPTSGTPNQYGLNGGKQTRIRQNGYVRGAQFAISNVSNLERFNICIWRRNYDSGMFTLVGKTENLKPNITIDGIQNILFSTPLYAKEGDYIGWECDGIDSVTPMITTSSVPTESADVVICHGINRIFNVSNQFNFLSSSMYQTSGKIFRINLYMDAVDTAFIGDSEVSGRPVHTSYVDPGTYYNPWSSMSFWWGV